MQDEIEKSIKILVWQDVLIHAYGEIAKLKGIEV
jgi:hypothetical protein